MVEPSEVSRVKAMSKKLVHLAIILDIEDETGDAYQYVTEAGELEVPSDDIQMVSAGMIDHLLIHEGIIEVSREEMGQHDA